MGCILHATALKAAIEKAEALKEADYTADSWKAMQLELQEAKDLLAKEKPTQAEIDEATTHLNAAVEALVKADTKVTVTLNKKKATVYKGKTTTLKATVTGTAAAKVTFTSSNPKVAAVNKTTGKVTAKAKGSAVITAKCGDVKVTCKVTVKNPTLTLNKTSASVKVGKTTKITAKAAPSGKKEKFMDKNNEQKNNKTPEMKPKQDSFRPWLKLIPAAAVFAAVCVTCYQADKSPVETVAVSDNSVMSTDEIKELISQGTAGKDFDSEDSSETNGTSISKTSKKTKKTSKIKTGTKKNSSTGATVNGSTAGGGAGSTVTPTTEVPAGGYADGTYTGSGTGFGGTITVLVTVTDHKIAAINIVDASNETASYFANAQGVISKILASQSPNVDAVSGATYSSKGIINAMKDILKQAEKDTTKVTPAPTPTPEETSEPTPEPTGPYIDGTYTGSSYGYSGRVNVTVTIQGGQIASIEQSNSDSPEYFDYAWETIYPQIMGNQSADGIDAASGATYSSEGILGAIQKALAQALA